MSCSGKVLFLAASILCMSCGANEDANGGDILEPKIQRAISVLADPESDNNQVRGALVAIYFCTPPAASEHLSRHFSSDETLIRGLAYQAAINIGESERIRHRLTDDVTSIVPNASGNKQLLLALATIEPPETFIPRVDALDLRNSVEFVARTANQFHWSGTSVKEALIREMLRSSSDGELTLLAARYMFEHDRVDLLREHRLVLPQPDPFETFTRLTGWDQMTREQRAAIIGEDQFNMLEEKAANPVPSIEPTIRQSVECWGFSVRQHGTELSIEGPGY